jgi:hypothetical protein
MAITLVWASATRPKPGHKPDENEDAVAAAPKALRFAVSDGATEGWQSGGWARRLAGAFVRRPPTPADFDRWLASVRKGWKPPPAAESWYAEIKQEQGSFATLLGVEFKPAKGRGLVWKAVAVGDSCLVAIREGKVELAFPVADVAEFGSRPELVPSSAAVKCPEPQWLTGRAGPGDLFLLATDAVAAALLRDADPPPRAGLLPPYRPDPVRLLRWLEALHPPANDDLSVIAVSLPAEPPR